MKTIARTLGLLVIGAVVFGSAAPASAAVVNERSVSAGIFPNRIAVTPDGTQTWTLATTSNELIGYTTGANLDLIATWPLPGTDYGSANVAILADGKHAIVTDASGDQVNIVDLATGAVTNPPALNGTATQLALSPDGSKVVIAYTSDLTPYVSMFTTADWSLVGTWLFLSHEITGLAFAPDGVHFAAVANANDRVYLADLSNLGDFVIVNTPDTPTSVAYSSDGESIFVGSFAYSSIRKFEALTGNELLSLFTERAAYLALSPDGTQLWASQPVSAQVGVYDTSNLSIIEAIPFIGNASGIAFAQFGCQAWVAQQFGGANIVFDLDPCLPGPTPALPDTGASPSVTGTSLAVSAGLLAAGALALIVVRRRNTQQAQ